MMPRSSRWGVVLLAAASLCWPLHAIAQSDTDAMLDGLFDGGGAAPQKSAKKRPAKKDKRRKRGKAARDKVQADEPSTEAAVSPAPAAKRKVVVPEFEGLSAQQVRQAVLEVLSEQPDIEIAVYEDVVVTARRLGADPKSDKGRRLLSSELGIFGWVEGRVTDDGALISLYGADGGSLSQVNLEGRSAGRLRESAVERVWRGIGPYLSDAERRRQMLEAYKRQAVEKLEARQAELLRQREVAAERERQRMRALDEQRSLARAKQAARLEEELRQRKVVEDRRIAEEQERKRQAEEKRQQLAEARKRRLEQQRAAQAAAQQAHQQPPAWGAPPPQQPAWGQAAPAAGGWSQPQQAPVGGAVSPETQRWLEQRGAVAQPAAPYPSAGPSPSPAAQQPQPDPDVDPGTLSPATRKWLEERGRTAAPMQ